MARTAFIGNGRLSVGFDEKGFVNDFYYPYVGMENMTSARFIHHKIGIWVDGIFSWLDSDEWHIVSGLDDHTMMNRVCYHSERLGISVSFRDFVDVSIDIFGRVAIIENHKNTERSIRLFFSQVFQISDAGRADTALYTPGQYPYILAYHGNISFAVGMRKQDGSGFDAFAVGNYGIEGKAGTYLDAEDGELSGNLVEHGGVDSVIGGFFTVHAKGSYHVDYWVTASDKKYSSASDTHRSLAKNGLFHFLNTTTLHWKKWLARSGDAIDRMDVKYQSLARKSLLTIKSHCDVRGGVIASGDSSIYNYGRDYYNYVWPRDAFYALSPLLAAGYTEEVGTYLHFLMGVMHKRGYVHHKYQPDSSLGSSWHPLVQGGIPELNIQEDETASSVMLAIDYINAVGINASNVKQIFDRIIQPCCDFMGEYFDEETGLPHGSYDLWEQVFLTTTYTTGTVYAALVKAAAIAAEIAPDVDTARWTQSAQLIERNIGKLFDEKYQHFVRGLKTRSDGFAQDNTLDIASLYSMALYGPAKIDDTTVFSTARAVEEYLVSPGPTGGVIRYPGDGYMLTNHHYKGNPWFVCTLWLGQYYLAIGDRDKAFDSLDWATKFSTKAGMLSEQVDPANSEVRGVAPLVWSHAEFLNLALKIYKTS